MVNLIVDYIDKNGTNYHKPFIRFCSNDVRAVADYVCNVIRQAGFAPIFIACVSGTSTLAELGRIAGDPVYCHMNISRLRPVPIIVKPSGGDWTF